jgi:hypothetical protein
MCFNNTRMVENRFFIPTAWNVRNPNRFGPSFGIPPVSRPNARGNRLCERNVRLDDCCRVSSKQSESTEHGTRKPFPHWGNLFHGFHSPPLLHWSCSNCFGRPLNG